MTQKKMREPNTILRSLRQERGWSLQRVADELHMLAQAEDENRMPGVNAGMIGVWERGVKKPGPYYQALFCSLYHRPASQLGFMSDQENLFSPVQDQELSAIIKHIAQAPHLAPDHARTQAIDLLCRTTPTTAEQQASAWLMLGASGLSQLFNEGWTLDGILESLKVVLQSTQVMTPISRPQLLRVGASAFVNTTIPSKREPTSSSEQAELEQALGASIAVGWKLFLTASPIQVLAFGQAQLRLLQQIRAYLPPQACPMLYSSVYRLIGITLQIQGRYEEALQAHQCASLAALEATDPWHMVQNLMCEANTYQALNQHNMSMQTIERAVQLLSYPTDQAQLCSKAHSLACWANVATATGDQKLAQKKLESSAALLDHIAPNEEFDHAHWSQFAGNCALTDRNYDAAVNYFEKALAELPQNWLIRQAIALMPLAVTYVHVHERDASLIIAERAIPVIRQLNAPTINKQFAEYIQQGLLVVFPHDSRISTFIHDTKQKLPALNILPVE